MESIVVAIALIWVACTSFWQYVTYQPSHGMEKLKYVFLLNLAICVISAGYLVLSTALTLAG
jgi:hypothetical protein